MQDLNMQKLPDSGQLSFTPFQQTQQDIAVTTGLAPTKYNKYDSVKNYRRNRSRQQIYTAPQSQMRYNQQESKRGSRFAHRMSDKN